PLAVTSESHDVTVAEERALFAAWQFDWFGAAPRTLEQTSTRFLRRARHRSAREQIACLKIATPARVVRNELRERPVHVGEAAGAHAIRIDRELAHAGRLQQHLERNRECTARSILVGREIRKRLRLI